MRRVKFILTFISLTCFLFSANCQNEEKEKLPDLIMINVSYGFQTPGGDLAKDFGINSDINFSAEYLKNRLLFGIEGNFIFGPKVRTDVLANIRTTNFGIVTQNKELATVSLSERGYYTGAFAGTILPFSQTNKRSGIRITCGFGFLQHKIKIVDITEGIQQISGDYKKGYDRLTNGLALKQFIGYHYLSNNKLFNFYFGVESLQGFTQNRRSYNFDTMMKDDKARVDLLFGLRLGWTVPIYLDNGAEKYYY